MTKTKNKMAKKMTNVNTPPDKEAMPVPVAPATAKRSKK
jgi:hypothetical protein